MERRMCLMHWRIFSFNAVMKLRFVLKESQSLSLSRSDLMSRESTSELL